MGLPTFTGALSWLKIKEIIKIMKWLKIKGETRHFGGSTVVGVDNA